MSNPISFQSSLESSKIILRFFENECKGANKKESTIDNLKFIFNVASEDNDDLEYCLACAIEYLLDKNLKAVITKNRKNTFEIYSDHSPSEASVVKIKKILPELHKNGLNKDIRPSDLYLESSRYKKY